MYAARRIVRRSSGYRRLLRHSLALDLRLIDFMSLSTTTTTTTTIGYGTRRGRVTGEPSSSASSAMKTHSHRTVATTSRMVSKSALHTTIDADEHRRRRVFTPWVTCALTLTIAMMPGVSIAAQEPETTTSPYIAELLRRTEANRDARRAELQNKYCARQASIGVGDCAGIDPEDLKRAFAESERALDAKRVAVVDE